MQSKNKSTKSEINWSCLQFLARSIWTWKILKTLCKVITLLILWFFFSSSCLKSIFFQKTHLGKTETILFSFRIFSSRTRIWCQTPLAVVSTKIFSTTFLAVSVFLTSSFSFSSFFSVFSSTSFLGSISSSKTVAVTRNSGLL